MFSILHLFGMGVCKMVENYSLIRKQVFALQCCPRCLLPSPSKSSSAKARPRLSVIACQRGSAARGSARNSAMKASMSLPGPVPPGRSTSAQPRRCSCPCHPASPRFCWSVNAISNRCGLFMGRKIRTSYGSATHSPQCYSSTGRGAAPMQKVQTTPVRFKVARAIELEPGLVLRRGVYTGTKTRTRVNSVDGVSWTLPNTNLSSLRINSPVWTPRQGPISSQRVST